MEDMEIFRRLGLDVKPIINAAGPLTMYGGASMPQQVLDAMAEVANTPVPIDELQAAASKVIAKLTGAEAGYVTCGASAALTLAAAACMTGYDVDRINRLPDTSGMANEVIIAHCQRCGYDHAFRAAGAKLVNVGMPSHPLSPGQMYHPKAEDYEAAISDHTTAIAYFYYGGGIPPLEEVVRVGKKYKIPIILDAANQLPPVENLTKFIAMGVDLVAVSGGKGIRGPQASGLLFGRRDLIAAAALNHLTPGFTAGTVSYDEWTPPPSLVSKEKLRAVPHHPLGRGCKVTKEAIVGLITALQIFADKERSTREMERLRALMESIAERLKGIPEVQLQVSESPPGGFPILIVKIDRLKLGRSGSEVIQQLKDGAPSIRVYSLREFPDQFIVNSCNLNEEQAYIVAEQLRAVLIS
jgi:L-seryl-tRNA(Ser) seleniumtransferase